MSFNRAKSKIMFHNKVNKLDKYGQPIKTYLGLEVTQENKMLGYMMDSRGNNMAHIRYITKKIQKA